MQSSTSDNASTRLEVIRQLLREGLVSSQEDLCEALKKRKFMVTQSTVSRDLRRIGAIKTIDSNNKTIYRLPDEAFISPVTEGAKLSNLLREITHNESMIVIHTSIGSASLVARQLDSLRPMGILGTIAGDDTIFVAPSTNKSIPNLIKAIRTALE